MGPYLLWAQPRDPSWWSTQKSQTLPVTREYTTLREVKWPLEKKGRFSSLPNAAAQEVIHDTLLLISIGQSDPNQPREGQEISSTQMPRRWKLKRSVQTTNEYFHSFIFVISIFIDEVIKACIVKWLTCPEDHKVEIADLIYTQFYLTLKLVSQPLPLINPEAWPVQP